MIDQCLGCQNLEATSGRRINGADLIQYSLFFRNLVIFLKRVQKNTTIFTNEYTQTLLYIQTFWVIHKQIVHVLHHPKMFHDMQRNALSFPFTSKQFPIWYHFYFLFLLLQSVELRNRLLDNCLYCKPSCRYIAKYNHIHIWIYTPKN